MSVCRPTTGRSGIVSVAALIVVAGLVLAVPGLGGGSARAAEPTDGSASGLDLTSPPVGETAPPLLLPTVADGRMVASDTLFDVASLTLVAFWTTHCAECVRRLEICQELADWGYDYGLQVIGVNFDQHPTSRIRLLSESATPRLMQLYDTGGRMAAVYGAGAHSFSIYLIDYYDNIVAVGPEIAADQLETLRPELLRLMEMEPAMAGASGEERAASGSAATAGPAETGRLLAELGLLRQNRLQVNGAGRLRWMDINTSGEAPTGPSGEEVEAGSFFHHRLELELIYAISPRLAAGGLLWLSNEGEEVLRSGPNYLSSPWGSAFARYDTHADLPLLGRVATSLRAGYYEAVFTPLLLQRWDKDDSPISGGQKVQGCGVCGGEAGLAGFLRSESLERLAPEYTFEGARLDLALGMGLDLTALYARPQRHRPEQALLCPLENSAEMLYRQELVAGRLTGNIALPWGSDAAALSASAVLTEDDPAHWSCAKRPDYDPGESRLIGADLQLPLPNERVLGFGLPLRATLIGEFVQSRWEPDLELAQEGAGKAEADAWRAVLAADLGAASGAARTPLLSGWRPADLLRLPFTRINIGYQEIDADFYAPYSALSYESSIRLTGSSSTPGLRGARGSLRLEWGALGLGGFIKRLEPIDEAAAPADETPSGERTLASLWGDLVLWSGGTLMVGWVGDDRDPLPGQGELLREERDTILVTLEQELAPDCLIFLEAQLLDGHRGNAATPVTEQENYETETIRCMIDVRF